MVSAAKKQRDIEAEWDSKAVSSAIEAAREVGINGRATISSLSEVEWTWICAAAIFAWIKTKARQATEEGLGYDIPIRTMKSRDPEPWEAGAVETILPALGDMNVPWELPLGEWPKEMIISLAWQMHRLVDSALAARDEGASDKVVQHLSQPEIEREASAANGGSLMSRAEFSDQIPF